jgi:exopolysaccharide biosynthesis WecB/TagA/CpsF family protein
MARKALKADCWSVTINPVRVAGIEVAPLSTKQWIDMLRDDRRKIALGGTLPRYHTGINGNVISVYARDPIFRQVLDSADAVAADGVSVMLASKWLHGVTIPDRAATTDLFHDIARAAEADGLSMYFLGATEDQNSAAVANVVAKYPKLKIAGQRNGYFSPDEEDAVVSAIATAKPDILWVGLGVPREDLFAVRNREKLHGVTWIKTCGGLFNFLSGKNARAPLWMRNIGLEWLFRMSIEPRRLAWRYATTNVHAIWLMLTRR